MAAKRLVYLGTPEVGVGPLRALDAAGHRILLVVSQPDKRRGRGASLLASPVKSAAVELGLPVSDRVDDIVDTDAELGVVVAFGRLIRPHVLAAVPMVNVHFSLLPRWRGAAPVERAILAGDTATGVCIIEVADELDAGAVYAERRMDIDPEESADELRSRLTEAGTSLLLEVVGSDPLPPPVPQVGEVTYAAKLRPEEWQLDWSRPAVDVHRWVRAGHAWTTFRGHRLGVLRVKACAGDPVPSAPGTLVDGPGGAVATGGGVIALQTVQPEGRGAMAWRDFANGARPVDGELLG